MNNYKTTGDLPPRRETCMVWSRGTMLLINNMVMLSITTHRADAFVHRRSNKHLMRYLQLVDNNDHGQDKR